MNAFAALTLLIAALVVYASMAFMGLRRRHEIGVRLALGSTRWGVFVRLVRRGAGLLVYGMALGGLLAVLGSAFLRRTLFPTESLDMQTASVAMIVVSVVAAVALLIPAWRATARRSHRDTPNGVTKGRARSGQSTHVAAAPHVHVDAEGGDRRPYAKASCGISGPCRGARTANR